MKKESCPVIRVPAIGTFCSCDKGPDMEPGTFKGTDEMEMDLVRIVNARTPRSGQGPLLFDGADYRYANGHADHIISKGGPDHADFKARASGLARESVGENVATGYPLAQDAFANGYSSADHRKTMEGNFTYTAASIKKDGEGNLYRTQLFYR